jgi:hypothetical protein
MTKQMNIGIFGSNNDSTIDGVVAEAGSLHTGSHRFLDLMHFQH